MAPDSIPADRQDSQDQPQSQPEKAERAKRQPVTVQEIVEAWESNERAATAGAVRIGQTIHRYLVQELAEVSDPGERREARALHLEDIAEHLEQAGYRPGNLSRVLIAFHVAKIFGPNEARQLALNVIVAFGRLVRRDAKSERWALKPEYEDEARGIWQRAVAERLSAPAVATAIDSIMPRAETKPKTKADKYSQAFARLGRLGSTREVFGRLGKSADREAAGAFVAGVVAHGDAETLALLRTLLAQAEARAAA